MLYHAVRINKFIKIHVVPNDNFNYYEQLFCVLMQVISTSGHMVPFCLFPLRVYGTQQSICHFPAVSIYNQWAIAANKASESGAATLLIITTTRGVTIDNSNGISITYMHDCVAITVMQIFVYT